MASGSAKPEVAAVDVGGWLNSLGLGQYEAAFKENAVDAGLLPVLTADDLKDLGITLVGHRRRLLEVIADLRLKTPLAAVSATPAPAEQSRQMDWKAPRNAAH